MEMVGNRRFTLTTGNGKRSKLRRLKNGVSQGSVLAPLLFNIDISDLPTNVSRKYAYADDPAVMHADGDWLAVERVLSKDMATLGEYIQSWKLKLSTTNTVSAAFHHNNKKAKHELKVKYNNKTLLFCSEPKYLSIVGQVAHVSPTPWVTSQVADIWLRAPEAFCWLRLGCWGNNSANCRPGRGALNRRVLRPCLLPQCSHLPRRPCQQQRLANCDRMLAPYTSEQPSNPRRHPTCWTFAMDPHCLWHAVLWNLDICHTQHSPVHRVQTHGASNRDTHLYSPHNIS